MTLSPVTNTYPCNVILFFAHVRNVAVVYGIAAQRTLVADVGETVGAINTFASAVGAQHDATRLNVGPAGFVAAEETHQLLGTFPQAIQTRVSWTKNENFRNRRGSKTISAINKNGLKAKRARRCYGPSCPELGRTTIFQPKNILLCFVQWFFFSTDELSVCSGRYRIEMYITTELTWNK